MKTISAELQSHLQQSVTTLAMCWKLTRTDGRVYGFTSCDTDIVFDGVTYEASTGFTPTAVASNNQLSVDNLDVEGFLDSESLSAREIQNGLFDYAKVDIFMVNYMDLSQGKMTVRRGILGQIQYDRVSFVAEIRGLLQLLSQNQGTIYQKFCRANFCDSKCKLNIATYTYTGAVTAVTDACSGFTDSANAKPANYYRYGYVTFTSGANAGLSFEVAGFGGGTFQFYLQTIETISVGDTYTAVAGCDKNLSTCKNKFHNAINFRGEPYVPGSDAIMSYPT